MKRIVSMTIATFMVFSMTACGGTKGSSNDSNKSILNIGVMDDGVGTEWLENIAADFEDYYKDRQFEDGKTGVEIIIDAKKDEFKIQNLITTMPYYDNTLYFCESFNHNSFYDQGLILDITDTVTEKIYDEDGNFAADTGKDATQSIIDTMYPEYKERLLKEGDKYYSLPHRVFINSIIYDADLFNSMGFYFLPNNQIGAKQADIDSGNCAPGPDGKMGTYDDGMPATWSQFMSLMDYMVAKSVTPFTWSGDTIYQKEFLMDLVWANYEGANDYRLNYSFDGIDSQFGKIDETNWTQLLGQEGRKAGIKASKDVVSNSKYYSAKADKQTFTEAQFEYVYSTMTNQKIAMFLEGSYWENEARSTFDEMAKTNKNFGYGQRNFKLLPIPNFYGIADVADQTKDVTDRVITATGANGTGVCIASQNLCENYEVQVELSKLFIQFSQRRDQLANFTRDTGGCFKVFNFEPTKEELSGWTKFGQSIWAQMKEGAVMVTDFDESEIRWTNAERFKDTSWTFKHSVFNEPISYFMSNPTHSVKQCFDNVYNTMSNDFKL